jgi:hypothetical protein
MPIQPPVIVVPGITATSLEDAYPIVPEEVWSAVIHKEYERIALHPDDIRYEAIEPARVQPRALFGVVYEDLLLALRHDLSKKADKPTPVFGFPYDWRQNCMRSADQLGHFIDEVLARTRLVPHYRSETVDRVDLVGHSMGGIIIADYLARSGKASRVRRVATLGTPFRGAIDAILKLTTGMGTLTGENPRDRERETARMTPALYQLLPSFEGAVLPDAGLGGDVFKVSTWQPSIIRTLAEYIKLIKADADATALFKKHLKAAQDLRDRTEGLSLAGKLPEGKDGWLAVVGLGSPRRSRSDQAVERRALVRHGKKPALETARRPATDGALHTSLPQFPRAGAAGGSDPEDFSWELKDKALAKRRLPRRAADREPRAADRAPPSSRRLFGRRLGPASPRGRHPEVAVVAEA